MLCRAWVSTSSVTNTLLTASSRMSGCAPFSIFIYPFYESSDPLVQLYSIVAIVSRHVGQNHLVADLQAILHFNGIHRTAAQSDFYLARVLAVGLHLEQLHRAVLLPEDRTLHEDHVV